MYRIRALFHSLGYERLLRVLPARIVTVTFSCYQYSCNLSDFKECSRKIAEPRSDSKVNRQS